MNEFYFSFLSISKYKMKNAEYKKQKIIKYKHNNKNTKCKRERERERFARSWLIKLQLSILNVTELRNENPVCKRIPLSLLSITIAVQWCADRNASHYGILLLYGINSIIAQTEITAP